MDDGLTITKHTLRRHLSQNLSGKVFTQTL